MTPAREVTSKRTHSNKKSSSTKAIKNKQLAQKRTQPTTPAFMKRARSRPKKTVKSSEELELEKVLFILRFRGVSRSVIDKVPPQQ